MRDRVRERDREREEYLREIMGKNGCGEGLAVSFPLTIFS